jgi:hypothetical protein
MDRNPCGCLHVGLLEWFGLLHCHWNSPTGFAGALNRSKSLLKNRAQQRIQRMGRNGRVAAPWCGEGIPLRAAGLIPRDFVAPCLVEEILAALPGRVVQQALRGVYRSAVSHVTRSAGTATGSATDPRSALCHPQPGLPARPRTNRQTHRMGHSHDQWDNCLVVFRNVGFGVALMWACGSWIGEAVGW